MEHKLLAAITNPVLPPLTGGGEGVAETGTAGSESLARFITSIMSFILLLAFMFLLIYLVTSGIAWITSEGDKTKLEAARNKLINAIIGIVIVAATWAVALLVGDFLGVEISNLPLPTLAP
jgi:hypothetical protein